MRRTIVVAAVVTLTVGPGVFMVPATPVEVFSFTLGRFSDVSTHAEMTPEIRGQASLAEHLYSVAAAWAGLPHPTDSTTAVRLVLLDDGGHVLPSFHPIERTVRVGLRAHPDELAHEIGHALVHALKPGYRSGAALAIHEAIADMFAVLVAYLDDRSFSRVLEETGGDLSLPNDAAEIWRADRSASTRLCLQDIGFPSTSMYLPDTGIPVPGTWGYPYDASIVLTAALHDFLYALCKADLAAGTALDHTVRRNAGEVGRLMFRALLFTGEHRVSLQDYAAALLRADRVTGTGPTFTPLLVPILVRRGFFASAEEAATACGAPDFPRFALDTRVTEDDEVLKRMYELEQLLLIAAKDAPPGRIAERYGFPLLFHAHGYTWPRIVDPLTVKVETDILRPDGLRLVRLSYRFPVDPEILHLLEAACDGDPTRIRALQVEQVAFASCLFDPSGALIAVHTDRPLPPPAFRK